MFFGHYLQVLISFIFAKRQKLAGLTPTQKKSKIYIFLEKFENFETTNFLGEYQKIGQNFLLQLAGPIFPQLKANKKIVIIVKSFFFHVNSFSSISFCSDSEY